MQNIVVDSSVIVKWLNKQDEKYTKEAKSILNDAREEKIKLSAPELAKYEVSNTLLIGKKLSISQMDEALDLFYSLPIHFFPDSQEQSLVTANIVNESRITYYDASFVSLADSLDATLVTDNVKHQAKAKGVKVIALKDYQ